MSIAENVARIKAEMAAAAIAAGRDPKEIDQVFMDLDTHLSRFSFDENNDVFAIVCTLCDAYEKRAFMDAIQIGAYLIMELQGN